MAAAKLLLGAQHPPPPRRGSPRLGVACFALSYASVVAAAVRGVNSKLRAAACFRKLRSALACLFAAYSSIPCFT